MPLLHGLSPTGAHPPTVGLRMSLVFNQCAREDSLLSFGMMVAFLRRVEFGQFFSGSNLSSPNLHNFGGNAVENIWFCHDSISDNPIGFWTQYPTIRLDFGLCDTERTAAMVREGDCRGTGTERFPAGRSKVHFFQKDRGEFSRRQGHSWRQLAAAATNGEVVLSTINTLPGVYFFHFFVHHAVFVLLALIGGCVVFQSASCVVDIE